MSEPLGILFLLAAIVFAYLYIATKNRISREVQSEVIRWREKELESQRQQMLQIARAAAKVELEQWKATHTVALRQDAIQRSQAVTIGKSLQQSMEVPWTRMARMSLAGVAEV